MGFFLVQHTQSLINVLTYPPSEAWDVTVETVVLKDENGDEIEDKKLLDSIQVLLVPSPDHVSNGTVYFKLHSKKDKIHLNVPQFGEVKFLITDDHIKIDEDLLNHKLRVTSPIEIIGNSMPYNP